MNRLYQSPAEIKQTLKRGLIYLLIAFPFILVIATILTIVGSPLWVIMLCNITVGGAVIIVEIVIYNKIKSKKKEQNKSNYDPFRD